MAQIRLTLWKVLMVLAVIALQAFNLPHYCEASDKELIYELLMSGDRYVDAFIVRSGVLILAMNRILERSPIFFVINLKTKERRYYRYFIKDAIIQHLFLWKSDAVVGIVKKEDSRKDLQFSEKYSYAIFRYDFIQSKYTEIYQTRAEMFPEGFDNENVLLFHKGHESREKIAADGETVIARYYSGKEIYEIVDVLSGSARQSEFEDDRKRKYFDEYDYTQKSASVLRKDASGKTELLITHPLPKKLLNYGYTFQLLNGGYRLIEYFDHDLEKYYILTATGEKIAQSTVKRMDTSWYSYFEWDADKQRLNYYFMESAKAPKKTEGSLRRIYRKALPMSPWIDEKGK